MSEQRITAAASSVTSAIAALEVELTLTEAESARYRWLLGTLRDLVDVLELLNSEIRPF